MEKKQLGSHLLHSKVDIIDGYLKDSASDKVHTVAQPSLYGQFIFRLLELLVILPFLFLFFLPLFSLLQVRSMVTGKDKFIYRAIIGQGGRQVVVRYFNVMSPSLAATGLLLDIVAGQISLVGRAIVSYDNHHPNPQNGYLSETKPGFFSLWNIRKSRKIGHEGRQLNDWEYHFTKDVKSDLFLLLRSVMTIPFQSDDKERHSKEITLFDISFRNTTMKQAIDDLSALLDGSQPARSVYFVNADCLNKTFTDSAYKRILQRADHVFPDGIGLVVAGRILKNPLRENVNGTDMLPYLCEMARRNARSLYLLGGREGVAKEMKQRLEGEFNVTIAGHHHGYFDHSDESDQIIEEINQSRADILLVAFGAPLQEKWIAANTTKLKPKIVMGVGGLFDFYSGNIKRAPRWLRELGLEWIYRIIQEPGRMWQRYVVGNPLFLWRVLQWKRQLPTGGHKNEK